MYIQCYAAQQYAPLMADEIHSEISRSLDGTQLRVWWKEQDRSNDYIVVVGDSCTPQDQLGPLCSIIKNAVCL